MKSGAHNFSAEKNPNGLVNLTLTPTSGGRIRNVSTLSYQAYSHTGASVRKFVGDEMDKYLNSQGLVRRSLPGRLEETLFRAVSETVYHSQVREEVSTIEKRVKEHMEVERKSRRITEGSPGPQDKLDLVRSVSACYSLNIVVYYLPYRPPVVIQSAKSEYETDMLCLYDLGHKYDFIYSMKKHESLAIAQGIIYHDLYCEVFGFNKAGIGAIVRRIRRDAETLDENPASSSSTSQMPESVRPVIPYSAAKSVDSSIYRNVPFDLANRMLKMQKTHGNSPGNVRFPPESHCLARRGEKFECAKVLGVVDKDVRLVCFLDNSRAQLSTRDLRGRGRLYSSVSQLDVSNQLSENKNPRNPVVSSTSSPTISMYTQAVPSVTGPHSPVLISGWPITFHLPPTYYVSRTSNHNSIEEYLCPESPKCTWWNKSLGQVNSAEDQYETWSFTNQPLSYASESATMDSIDENITQPGSDFTGSSGSLETISPSSLFTTCEVPFITSEQLKLVDKSASFSFDENGKDLPSDINTLRYFFNLGLLSYQNQENNSVDNYQDISFNSNVSASTSDVPASNGETPMAPYFITSPHFQGPMGVSMQYTPPQEHFIYSPGLYFPQPPAAILPVDCPTFYGCNRSEQGFFF